MNDQPREEKAPEGTDHPTVEQPTAPTGAADQPTTQQPAAPGEPATQATPAAAAPGEPAAQATPAPGQPAAQASPASAEQTAAYSQQPPPAAATPGEPATPAAAQGQPAAAAPGESGAQAAPAAADQTAAHGQQPPPAPPTPQLSQPGPGQAYGGWTPPPANAPRQPGGFRRFAGHRATQLVGVGLLGLLIGGGVVGGIAIATSHHGPRDGRPGIHRQYNGPGQGPDGRGFPGRGGGNSGSDDGTNSGPNNGSGDGI